ncbi:hypothetical protein JQX13_33605 [Archangium violaceum]|uniref:hypothetical protein n=1 Tax=Archangium violaceum TaxID=83451 RepID=UPI00193BC570|nr:hypothetical protein [Archangium violaceum]QRK05115.1 hypothetical protein JQX13_33605 [Archangium violaceum]
MSSSWPALSLSAWVLLLGALWGCQPARTHVLHPAGETPALRYRVTYVREPGAALDVELTRVREDAPRDFLFTQPGGVDRVSVLGQEGPGHERSVSSEGRVLVPPDTRLLRYRYPLDARARGTRSDFFTGMGEGDAWHVAGRAWLLRPRRVTPSLRAELVVEGVDALPPWTPDASGVYRLEGGDLVDSGFHGFGGRRCTVRLPGAVVEVAVLGRMSRMDDAALCAWIHQAAREVLTVRRSFPYPRITVRLVPMPGRGQPAPFGMVLWSSPPSISLLVGQDAAPAAFASDWVAVHELLHLAHPTFVPRIAWLSEGLATYYTELARARSGRQTPERAWTELLAGFARGRAAVGSRTMEDVITRGASYQGTYWTGALFALRLDVELRRVTGNTRSLDTVLERLAGSGSTATFDTFGAAVDAVAGQPLFQVLLDRHLSRPAFAGLEPLLEALGVAPGPDGVELESARDSPVREALTAPGLEGAVTAKSEVRMSDRDPIVSRDGAPRHVQSSLTQ